jgi:hypothetical protein
VPYKFTTAGGATYGGAAAYIRILFTRLGLFVAAYILIGVFYNTAPPHFPSVAFGAGALHSWIQYAISILLWPLSFWHPLFTVSHWSAGSAPR